METAVNLGWTASKNETTFGIGCKVFTNFKSWFHELFSLLLLTNDFFSSLLWKRMPSFVLRSITVLKLDLVINISSVMVSYSNFSFLFLKSERVVVLWGFFYLENYNIIFFSFSFFQAWPYICLHWSMEKISNKVDTNSA